MAHSICGTVIGHVRLARKCPTRNGKVEKWKSGKVKVEMEKWKSGKVEKWKWKVEKVEKWKSGKVKVGNG